MTIGSACTRRRLLLCMPASVLKKQPTRALVTDSFCKSIMAEFWTLRHRFSLSLFVFSCSLTLISNAASSLSIGGTATTNPNFDSGTVHFGDAVNGKLCAKLKGPSNSSFGLLMRAEPFKFLDGKHPTSFSSELSFSIFPGESDGDGLVLVFIPSGSWSKWLTAGGSFPLSKENKFRAVEFDIKMDGEVEINVNGLVSSVSSVPGTGGNNELQSWIDYDPSSKRLEVRLAKSGDRRPYDPITACDVDLAEKWRDEDVRVGIASRNGSVCSWRFMVRKYPNTIHSMPVEPQSYVGKEGRGEHARSGRKTCPFSVDGGLIFAALCVASVAFVGMFLWVIFVKKHMAESPGKAAGFGYQKFTADVEKTPEA